MRSFDPRRVGALECRAWETYYRREWPAFLAASVGLVRAAFGMSWARTLLGAWLVLRANQVWAPYPNNDPDSARRLMTRFYQLLRKSTGEGFHPGRAAWLEVEWWRVHREAQHAEGSGPSEELTVALRAGFGSKLAWLVESEQPVVLVGRDDEDANRHVGEDDAAAKAPRTFVRANAVGRGGLAVEREGDAADDVDREARQDEGEDHQRGGQLLCPAGSGRAGAGPRDSAEADEAQHRELDAVPAARRCGKPVD
jgi:hypothetical protein